MPARATKNTPAAPRATAAGHRRGGRPRAATAASRIYLELRAELVSLQRRPGEPVSEAEIAMFYGVSRTPVREAILKLADEGLVRHAVWGEAGQARQVRSRRFARRESFVHAG